MDKIIHSMVVYFGKVRWRKIKDVDNDCPDDVVEYYYCESEQYALRFPNNTYAFVMARSPLMAYENWIASQKKIKDDDK